MHRSPLPRIGTIAAAALVLLLALPLSASAQPSPPTVSAPTSLASAAAPAAAAVAASNTAPVAIDQSLAVAQNTSISFVLSGTDPDGDTLSFSTSTPANGTLSGVAPNLTYTPTPGYSGPDVFVFRVSDTAGATVVATAYISVYVPPNDPPVAFNQAVSTTRERPIAITLAAVDGNQDPLTYALLTWSYCHCSAQHGTVLGTPPNVTYTPRAGYTGTDYFEFRVTDDSGASGVGRVDITVATRERGLPRHLRR